MTLHREAAFYDAIRRSALVGPVLSTSEFQGIKAIVDTATVRQVPISHLAYLLATAYHETNHTFEPVKEAYWLSADAQNRYFFRMYDPQSPLPNRREVARELGNTQPGDGVKYPGMGLVQCTGRRNAMRAQLATGQPIVDHPELLMQLSIAAIVLVVGCEEGWFSGKKLSDYLYPGNPPGAFIRARRVVNGTDRANDIAVYARSFQDMLVIGDWR